MSEQVMLVGVSVGPDGRPNLVLRCAACDDESRATDGAFISWEWPHGAVGLASMVATAEAHRRRRHGKEQR